MAHAPSREECQRMRRHVLKHSREPSVAKSILLYLGHGSSGVFVTWVLFRSHLYLGLEDGASGHSCVCPQHLTPVDHTAL